MNSLEALLSDTRKTRSLRGLDLVNKEDEVLVVGNCDPKQSNSLGTMRSGIVSVNHKISLWVILIRSNNLGKGERM
jgi:hypothetical protein